tara:strand:- start:4446 stop:5387 length:942 start_codon:yes stop_codon:yes gene_type:complete
MISRRHLRVKVMQSLYSFFSINSEEIDSIEKKMVKSIEESSKIQVLLCSLLVSIHNYASDFFKDSKKSQIKSNSKFDSINKFLNNKFILLLKRNTILMKKIDRSSVIWKKSDLDIVRKIFVEIINSTQYDSYINNYQDDFDQDKNFIQIILNDFILDNNIFHHILEEKSIFFIDDLPFVSIFLKSQIYDSTDEKGFNFISNVFKSNDDKKFALKLFRETILKADEFEKIIDFEVKNWEVDRISKIDLLMIKMALVEIVMFPEMPISVTFNEYIEISKYYSTKKSKVFINGVLDKVVSRFKKENRFSKTGKGLL